MRRVRRAEKSSSGRTFPSSVLPNNWLNFAVSHNYLLFRRLLTNSEPILERAELANGQKAYFSFTPWRFDFFASSASSLITLLFIKEYACGVRACVYVCRVCMCAFVCMCACVYV